MLGEIIAIGDELISGRILNTSSGFAARRLFGAGHELYAMHTIGDDPALIGEALHLALGRVDFVIVTGGLGSTSDDLTNEAVAQALDRPTMPHAEVLEQIRLHLGERASSLEKLAWLPEGAEVLNADARMAGYQLVHAGRPIFFLPGVPGQMKHLLLEQVLPRLAAWSDEAERHVAQRIYRVFGLDEDVINQRLREVEGSADCRVGYYPVDVDVHVSCTVQGRDGAQSAARLANFDERIRAALGDCLYGTDRLNMATVLGGLLAGHGMRLAVAESCTGGLIGYRLTAVPGSSAWFSGGVIAYANALKERLLGVAPRLLEEHGAVSGPVARAMAQGARERTGAELAVAVTGIAGPDGGSEEKPVGTVYLSLASAAGLDVRLCRFAGDRREVRQRAAQTALDLARRYLLGLEKCRPKAVAIRNCPKLTRTSPVA